MRALRRRLDESVEGRLCAWMVFGSGLTILFDYWSLSFPTTLVGDLLAARLALLGLVGAVATFQYGVWSAGADRAYQQINDPRWIQFEADLTRDRLDPNAIPAALRTREAALTGWRAWREDRLDGVVKFALPYNRIVLTNYLAAAYLLLVSVVTDLVSLLLGTRGRLDAALAAAMFLASLAPFVGVWRRYAAAVFGEFQMWERAFQPPQP